MDKLFPQFAGRLLLIQVMLLGIHYTEFRCMYPVGMRKECCPPKQEGGLGVHDSPMEQSSFLFQVWRLINVMRHPVGLSGHKLAYYKINHSVLQKFPQAVPGVLGRFLT